MVEVPGVTSSNGAQLTAEDRKLLEYLQSDFPLVPEPYLALSERMRCAQAEMLGRVQSLKRRGVIRHLRGTFDSKKLGYQSTLVAMSVEPAQLDAIAALVSKHPGVSHNYGREHEYNLWFTLTVPPEESLPDTFEAFASASGVKKALLLPALQVFKIDARFDLIGDATAAGRSERGEHVDSTGLPTLSDLDKAGVVQLQTDLPLMERPFDPMAKALGITVADFLDLVQDLLARGIMRRYGAVVNHRRAGYTANAMGCWIAPASGIEEVGKIMASFSAVSHCYQRPTFTDWPYNLFTMIHGKAREECEEVATEISRRTKVDDYVLLYSIREYKKESVKYFL